jgi:formylglycine-generating enzyme required for sulfatase activity
MSCVSWNDARAYVEWLSQKTGHRYRLPSASEWEYAAVPAAGDLCAQANVADQSAAERFPGWKTQSCRDGYTEAAPVGSFAANSFGLHDMYGNVFEWTEDCWQDDYRHAAADGSPQQQGNCAERELRGGSWFTAPQYLRRSYRNRFATDYRSTSVGLRIARDIEP